MQALKQKNYLAEVEDCLLFRQGFLPFYVVKKAPPAHELRHGYYSFGD